MTRTVEVTEEIRLDIVARDVMRTDAVHAVELLLDANQGLAAAGPYLQAGHVLTVPEIDRRSPVLPAVAPWD